MTQSVDELIRLANTNRTPYMIELGHNYLKGHDYEGNEFPQDFSEAKKWLEKAHVKGATTASFLLGTMYEEGIGMPRDISKAIELYEFATQRGGYLAHLHLARIYAKGDGVEKSPDLAAKWYKSVLNFGADEVGADHFEEAKAFINNIGLTQPVGWVSDSVTQYSRQRCEICFDDREYERHGPFAEQTKSPDWNEKPKTKSPALPGFVMLNSMVLF